MKNLNFINHIRAVKKAFGLISVAAGLLAASQVQADDANPYYPGLAAGEYKFLGNISGTSNKCNCNYTDWINPANNGFDINNHFTDYWNQLSPENTGKWQSMQPTNSSSWDWSQFRAISNYDQYHGVTMKEHTLVWGSQLPSWFANTSDKKGAMENWIKGMCGEIESYQGGWTSGHAAMVDVVNEPVNTTTTDFTTFKNSIKPADIGEQSSTGYDWIIWAFQKARQYCPHEKLILNEYNVLHKSSGSDTTQNTYLTIAKLLKARNLIDGLGTQSHQGEIDGMTAQQVEDGLTSLDSAGIPLYVTELDIDGCDVNGSGGGGTGVKTGGNCSSDSIQNTRYQAVFPKLWEHSTVQGVTLWGYVQSENWFPSTHLINTDGSDRPAMTWLKKYFNDRRNAGTPSPDKVAFSYLIAPNKTIVVRAKGTTGAEKISLVVNNQTVASWTLSKTMANYTADSNIQGSIRVQFTNDATGRDVQVDYITVNGTTKQSEAQKTNTGYYANGKCGGAGFSEMLHCNGYIDYGNL